MKNIHKDGYLKETILNRNLNLKTILWRKKYVVTHIYIVFFNKNIIVFSSWYTKYLFYFSYYWTFFNFIIKNVKETIQFSITIIIMF